MIATRSLLAHRPHAYLAAVVTEIGLPQLARSKEETESLSVEGPAGENNNRLEVHECGSSYLTLEILSVSRTGARRASAPTRSIDALCHCDSNFDDFSLRARTELRERT